MDFLADLMKRVQPERQGEEESADKDSSFARLPLLFTESENILKNGFDFASALSLPQTSIQGLLRGSDSIFLPSSANSSFTDPDSVQKTNAHVLELQNKLVCLQQQLNAAVTANYTKNIMIEQLDKILARIMEGWKKHEAEKSARISELEKECEAAKETLDKGRNALIKTEEELGQTLQKLMNCQKEILDAQQEKHRLAADHQSELKALEDIFKTKQSQLQQFVSKLQATANDQAEVITVLREQIQMEQESRQLLETEKNDCLNKTVAEVQKLQEELGKAKQTEANFRERVLKLQSGMDDAIREKESIKVELSIMEDRIEAEKRAQEVKLKQEFAGVIQDLDSRLDEVHGKLTSDHAAELQKAHEEHLRAVESEIQKRVDLEAKLREEFRTQLKENHEGYTTRLDDSLKEKEDQVQELSAKLLQLQQRNDLLASGRSQLMSKFQELLQTQWQEALGILYGKADSALMLNLDYRLPSGYVTESCQHELSCRRRNAIDFSRILAGQFQGLGSSPRCKKLYGCCSANGCADVPRICLGTRTLQITPHKKQPKKEASLCSPVRQHRTDTSGGCLFDVNHCSPPSEKSCYHRLPHDRACSTIPVLQPSVMMTDFSQRLPNLESSSNIFDWLNSQPQKQNAAPHCPISNRADKHSEMLNAHNRNTAQPNSEIPVSQASSIYHSCNPYQCTQTARRDDCDRLISNSVAGQQSSSSSLFRDSGISVTENSRLRGSTTAKPVLPTPDVSAIGNMSKTYDIISNKTTTSQNGSGQTQYLPSSRECSRSSSDVEGHHGQRNPADGQIRSNLRYPYSTPMHDYTSSDNRKKMLHTYMEKLLQKPPRSVQESLDTEPCRDAGKKVRTTFDPDQGKAASGQKTWSTHKRKAK